ncbi:MAG: zf-HC2 domain-containing protein [Acidobacteria bacterium]|nr:zf-HC2 domain-containing protein [Acidobacteriota bacterium]
MDCLHFSDRIEALVDGAMPEDERLRAAAHAAGCPDCRALLATMQEVFAPAIATPRDLTEAILAQTSGPACGQAQALVGDLIDGALDSADQDLCDAHLRHCPTCTAILTALVRLAEDLPSFAELPPDPPLVDDVLARTRPRQPRWIAFRDRMRETGLRLLTRPRVAWEAGCVAALAVWLICGASWSPLRGTAVEAQALVERSAAGAQAAGVRSVAALGHTVAALRGETVRVAAGGASEVSGWLSGLSSWRRRAASAAPELDRHWRQFLQAVRDRDLFAGVDALHSIGRDAGAMLAELPFPPFSSSTTTEAAPNPAGRSRP